MATGIVHRRDSILLAATGATLLAYLGQGDPQARHFALGAFLGIALSPDLDSQGMTHGGNRMLKPVLFARSLWKIYWWPYARLIPHRHFISHFPLLGTALRLFYLAAPALIWMFFTPAPLPSWETLLPWKWLLAGLAASDFLHWLRDGCPVKI